MNDCALVQTAHINGYSDWFGNKREFSEASNEPSSAMRSPLYDGASRGLRQWSKIRDEQNQRDEDAVIRFLLKYIIENQQQHKETVGLADKLCIERTGLPC
ncbi:hypothetical protein EB796_022978 [Bugula neritina]|uniref:Uncharacterized protein n=1 Tax=Bugula neritina TaxID=10212 RepID=A0A7J7IY23_BUGNE|nr:hypothetical protein EB796_022978 [Bugula neritina]